MNFPAAFRRSIPVRQSALIVFILALLLPSFASAQQKPPAPGPAARKPARRSPAAVPSAAKDSQKDPVAEHYRAAETFQLAGDLNSTEMEYHRVVSLALQRLAHAASSGR